MMLSLTILRYEALNALRSKWLYGYALFIIAVTYGFFYLSDNPTKAALSIATVLCVVVPLVSVLFGTMAWYQSERFTQLMLTQPVSRGVLFFSRFIAMCFSFAIALLIGLVGTALLMGRADGGIVWLFGAGLFLSTAFTLLGSTLAGYLPDRMWGLGGAVLLWLYCALLHDGVILLVLLHFREYSMDLWAALLCALNPIGLARVVLMLHFDAPLLLGHSGALVRNMLEGSAGMRYGALIAALWLLVPLLLSYRRFVRRDF